VRNVVIAMFLHSLTCRRSNRRPSATSPQLEGKGGLYCQDVDVAPLAQPDEGMGLSDASTRLVGVMPYAVDRDEADRLWEMSEHLVFGRQASR
jgi:hypothetical protein